MSESTIAELYGLDHDDPWDKRNERRKADDAKIDELRAAIKESPPVPAELLDPADDESLIIRQPAGARVYYRIAVMDLKLAALLSLEPSLINISAAGRNNAAGCWTAVTGRRVAQQMASRLESRGFKVAISTVDGSGKPIRPLTDAERESVAERLIDTKPNRLL